MQDVYLCSRFTFNGIKSYDLPLLGLSLKERLMRTYPEAVLHLDEEIGKNGEDLLALPLTSLTVYSRLCARLQAEILIGLRGQGVLVEDEGNTRIEEEVHIGAGTVVRSGSYIERGVRIGERCTIGPYAYLRKGTEIGHGCRVGDFVEIKNSLIGDFSKVAHLAYVGDADVGRNCNVGCGAVFVNYDGRKKRRTVVEDNVFIGSNANLVAPVYVGAKSYIACGSTVTENLEAGDFCIARCRQVVKRGKGSDRFTP